jgi:aspartate aminotransferase
MAVDVSSRIRELNESITLKLNAKACALADSGKRIFNLTAGQLPFRPMPEFVELLRSELNFLKSFQYPPVAGLPLLRQKVKKYFADSRKLPLSTVEKNFDCIISNGGKHSVSNALGALIDHGDEVILLAPYWVSYPEIIRFCKGTVVVVNSNIYDAFIPNIDDIKKVISSRTKAIIVNSPNNPSGIHYPDNWMKDFADLMTEHSDVSIISDEIYYEVNYFDPAPTYFYQHRPELLERTIIIDGISKNLACTGLRIGFCLAPKSLVHGMGKLQGQTTSGASSLVQRALINFDFDGIKDYLIPIKSHLRRNADILREKLRDANLSHCFYQPLSAFYYLIDFTQTPKFTAFQEKFAQVDHLEGDVHDISVPICEYLLEEHSIALVPGSAFGLPNTARISLVLENGPFTDAMEILTRCLSEKA